MKSQPEPIKNIIKEVIKEASFQRKDFEGDLIENWNQWIEEPLLSHLQISNIKNKTLFILTDHPSWIAEFNAKHSDSLLQSIKRNYGEDKIKKIVVTVGSFKRR